jgi:ankyrin repeat protein
LLTHCIKLQSIKAVEVLLKCGADANQQNRKGVAPISVAAHKGNVPILKLLIQFGGVVNAINNSSSIALIQAAHFGHVEAVKLLLAHHSNADYANAKGTTALMRAAQEGHLEISQLLIGVGVDVNRRNHEGMNALMLASQRGHADIVMRLIKANAVMDEQTAQGSTALMLACKRGHERCVEVLVTMGAEIFLRDRHFCSAKDTAMKRNHLHLLPLLDTQFQVRRIQEIKHRQRSLLIVDLRRAYLQGRLQLVETELSVHNLIEATRVTTIDKLRAQTSLFKLEAAQKTIEAFHANQGFILRSGTLVSKDSKSAMQFIQNSVSQSHHESLISKIPSFPSSLIPAKKVSDYADWQWVSLLYRCMSLPEGVFELVMDMLPLPRVWHWTLDRLARRCKLAPQQAMLDMSVMMDEILADSVIVEDRHQCNLLVKLNRAPYVSPSSLTSRILNYFLLYNVCYVSCCLSVLSMSFSNSFNLC